MFSEPKRRIEADEFVLRDASGSMRAGLTMTLDGPGLFLYDQSGIVRAGLLIGKDEPGLALFDSLGRPRVSLGMAADEPTLMLRDAKGTSRLAMTVAETGTRLMLSDADSGPRLGFAAQSGEASMVFADPNGKPRVVLGMPGGVPGLTLLDAGGRRRAKLEIADDTSTFELYDADGKTSSSRTVVWVEPRLNASEVEAKLALEAAARKQLDEALQSREKRFTALTAALVQLVWTTNAVGEVIEDVPSWRCFTGQSEEEAKGLGWVQALHPEDRERAAGVLKQALEMRGPFEVEYRVRRQDGEYREFAVRAVPVLQVDEGVGEWVMAATDISERKRLEEALRVSEGRLSALTAASTQLQETLLATEVSHTADRRRLEEALRSSEERLSALNSVKSQLEESLRVSEERHEALTVASTELRASWQKRDESHGLERQRLEEALQASEARLSILAAAHADLEEKQRTSAERYTAECKRLEEALRACEERHSGLTAAKSQLEETLRISVEGCAAERKQLEKALRASDERLSDQIVANGRSDEARRATEKRYSALAAGVAELGWTANGLGDVVEAGPSWLNFTGQSAAQAEGEGWTQAVHPEDREAARKILKQAVDTRSPYKTEYRLRRHDGEYRILAVHGMPVLDDDRAAQEWIVTATDVTENKLAETTLRASERKYRQIVEGAPEGVGIIDPENRTLFANPRLAQMLGWSESEMLGKSLFDFLDEEARQCAVENLACCRRGVAVQHDLKLRNKGGVDLRTRVSARPLFDEVGQYSGALALIIDVTEQKRLEAKQQHVLKLQALGQLAGGVAHGLNNLLTVINGYSELLLGKVPRNDPMHESVAQIKKAGAQAAGVVAPLLAFSQGQILRPRVLDLNEVVTEAEKTLRGQLGADIRLTTSPGPNLGPVKADPKQLLHAVMNLAANARDAMPSGGSLVIETQNVDLDECYAAEHPDVQPGPFVQLKVSDSGVGMGAETLAHVFEPYFTTKAAGQGIGLGLAAVYGIIQQSGGSIRAESELGKGSSICVYLPRLAETLPLREEGTTGVTTLRGTETVLVVDDQEAIRKLAQTVLKSYGYNVLVAANGWEALLYSERHSGPIHLLVTDVMMPGMTGQELADRFKPLRPEMEILFMSGYVENGAVQPAAPNGGAGFLAKPFSPDALAMKVREALGAPRSAGRVLVIDSETGIRSFLRMILESVGYEVLEANDAEQALNQMGGDDVDLLLVDLDIPGQQELEKICSLQKRRPDVKLIAMSEALGDEFLRTAEQLGAQSSLAKPIRADQLLELVRQALTE